MNEEYTPHTEKNYYCFRCRKPVCLSQRLRFDNFSIGKKFKLNLPIKSGYLHEKCYNKMQRDAKRDCDKFFHVEQDEKMNIDESTQTDELIENHELEPKGRESPMKDVISLRSREIPKTKVLHPGNFIVSSFDIQKLIDMCACPHCSDKPHLEIEKEITHGISPQVKIILMCPKCHARMEFGYDEHFVDQLITANICCGITPEKSMQLLSYLGMDHPSRSQYQIESNKICNDVIKETEVSMQKARENYTKSGLPR